MRSPRVSRFPLLLAIAALAWSIPGSAAAVARDGAAGSAKGLDANVGSLPFTGWDLIILAGIALVLSGVGFGLRRLSSPRPRGI